MWTYTKGVFLSYCDLLSFVDKTPLSVTKESKEEGTHSNLLHSFSCGNSQEHQERLMYTWAQGQGEDLRPKGVVPLFFTLKSLYSAVG